MTQKFYKKTSVQVAMVTGIFLILIAFINIWHQRSELRNENIRLNRLTQEQTAENQRLETLLTPFRTIALEKFTGTEGEVLQQLAERVTSIDASLADAMEELESTKQELLRKTSDRSLTEEQTQILKSSLDGVFGKVLVKADFADSEARIFANQIEYILTETDLDVIEQGYTGIISLNAKGIYMLVSDIQNPPPHAVPIQKAFQLISIDVPAGKSEHAEFPHDALIIWVCHR